MLTAREHMAYAIGVTKHDSAESRTTTVHLLAKILKFPPEDINKLVNEINDASDGVINILKKLEKDEID